MPLSNFGLVTKVGGASLWRAQQPDGDGFAYLKALGMGGAFKLNSNAEYPNSVETKLVAPGFVSLVPMNVFEPNEKVIRGIVSEIQMALVGGVSCLVHCTHGRDRTGLVIGAYRAIVDHWTFDQIQIERDLYGANWLVDLPDAPIIAILRKFVGEGK